MKIVATIFGLILIIQGLFLLNLYKKITFLQGCVVDLQIFELTDNRSIIEKGKSTVHKELGIPYISNGKYVILDVPIGEALKERFKENQHQLCRIYGFY